MLTGTHPQPDKRRFHRLMCGLTACLLATSHGLLAEESPESIEIRSTHWAFRPPQRVAPPVSIDKELHNPIDRLLAAARDDSGLKVSRPASRLRVLRRVYLDLIGLPPDLEEQRRYLADDRPDAHERLVDELLASPHHGERWARHWMDVWRYTDWYGLGAQLRYSQKHIWRWRDWIIDALNQDKGYDRMILEMLAADELFPTDAKALAGTGFLARNYYLFNRTTWLDQTIEHGSKALMGLTINCAKCHDHKYDPISQEEYYRLRAIFEPHQVRLDSVPGERNLDRDGLPRVFDAHPKAKTLFHVGGNPKRLDTSIEIIPDIPAVLGLPLSDIQPVDLPLTSHSPAMRNHVLEDALTDAQRAIDSARRKLEKARNQASIVKINASGAARPVASTSDDKPAAGSLDLDLAEKRLAAALKHPRVLRTSHAADRARRQARPTDEQKALARTAADAARDYELTRAEARLLGARVEVFNSRGKPDLADKEKALAKARQVFEAARKALEQPGTKYSSIRASRKALEGPDETEASRYAPYPKRSTGRRSAFARWLTDHRNPLTARVAVNHVWLRHFGQALVPTVTDFGTRAPTPKQLALLDYLAVEFMESGWSFKHLHRLIVTSQAYRMQSSSVHADKRTAAKDPENEFYWRRRPTRMEAQVIRDSLLHLSGKLDRTIGGPSLDPNTGDKENRRSIYFLHSRDHKHPFLHSFDDADIFRCYRRTESIVPQQALALSNSRLSLSLARELADRIHRLIERDAADSDKTFVRLAFRTVLTRGPDSREARACLEALRDLRELSRVAGRSDADSRARSGLVHALINHNDFITIR